MTINGVEFDVDFTDADLLERVEKEREQVLKKCEELENNQNLSSAEGIRQTCKVLKNFLNCVFGYNVSEKAFGNKDSLKDCIKAYEDIFEELDKQHNEMKDIFNKYSPDRLK